MTLLLSWGQNVYLIEKVLSQTDHYSFKKIRKAYRKYDIEAWRRALKIGKPAFNRLREALRQDPEKLWMHQVLKCGIIITISIIILEARLQAASVSLLQETSFSLWKSTHRDHCCVATVNFPIGFNIPAEFSSCIQCNMKHQSVYGVPLPVYMKTLPLGC